MGGVLEKRLRTVAVYFGLADSSKTPEPTTPRTVRYLVKSSLALGLILGIGVGWQRSPELGAGFAVAVTVACSAGLLLQRAGRAPERKFTFVSDVAGEALFNVAVLSAFGAAAYTDDSVVDAIEGGVAFGVMVAAISAVIEWRDRRHGARTVQPSNG